MYGFIYKITNLENEKVYIGKTVNIFSTLRKRHINNLKFNRHYNSHLQNSWNKYSEKVFQFEVIYSFVPIEYLNQMEILSISLYDSSNPKFGFNKTFGGDGGELTSESRKKISLKNKGRKHSEEHRIANSDAQKIAQNREETLEKHRNARKNIKKPEHSLKMKELYSSNVEMIEQKREQISGSKNPMSFVSIMNRYNCSLEEARSIRKQILGKHNGKV